MLALRRRPRGQGDKVVVVDVHSLGRPVSVLEEERGVLRLRAVLPHRRRRRPHVPVASVVLRSERREIRIKHDRGRGRQEQSELRIQFDYFCKDLTDLVTCAAHLSLWRGVSDVTENAAVEALWFCLRCHRRRRRRRS